MNNQQKNSRTPEERQEAGFSAVEKSSCCVGTAWENDFLFEQYPDAILLVDEAGKIVGANQNLSEMFGYEKPEMIGNSIEMLLPENLRRLHVKKRNQYIKSPKARNGRPMETGMGFQARRKDGSCFPIDIMLSPANSGNGRITVTVVRDISEKIMAEENERQAKEALKAIFDAAPVAIFSVGRDKKVISWSRAAEKLFGYSAQEAIALNYEDDPCIIGKSKKCLDLFERVFAGSTVRNHTTYRRHKNGNKFQVSIDAAPMFDDHGNIYAITYSAQDISERIKAEERERKANDTLKAVVDSAPMAIFVLARDRTVLSWSRQAEKLFGYRAEEVIGKPYKLIPADEREENYRCSRTLSSVFEGNTIHDMQRYRLRKDGTLVGVSISAAPIFQANGEIKSAAYCAQDITERLRNEEELNRLAFRNRMTELPNRECLKKNLNELLNGTSDCDGKTLFVAKFRFEGFLETINSLGSERTAKLIRKVAARMVKNAPDNGRIFHTDRYDFTLAMYNVSDPLAIMNVVRPLLERASYKFEIEGHPVHLRANVGLAIGPDHGKSPEDILSNAELALNSIQSDKTGRVRLFDMSMKSRIQAKRQLDVELRRAFRQGEFELFYQPQIRLEENRLAGAEALLRWRHPERGIMQPASFIDALAKNPIAHDVGNWIMQSATRQAAEWQKQGLGELRIGVNLFGAQFERETLVGGVENALAISGLKEELLELEITENIAIGMKKSIIEPLKTLRNKGVGIAFDDFGTGYASLSYLIKYPLSRIKIDKSFLEHIPHSCKEAAIVHSIILMAHSLGLEVIAEGIEIPEHISFLKRQICEEGQGYYYARPLPADEFYEFARTFGRQGNAALSNDGHADIAGAA